MKTSISLTAALDTLKAANTILLMTHVQPDGDAIGSTLAAAALLRRLGKDVTAICQDPVPPNLRVLPGWENLQTPALAKGKAYDLVVSLDSSDLARLGESGDLFKACDNTLVIDHHASNTYFGRQNHVDSLVAATGNLVFRLYTEAGLALDQESATLLYAAISTDTGNFSFGQMDEEFFVQVSKLMAAGLDIVTYARALHLTKELSFYKLLARALASLTFCCNGKMSHMRLSASDFEETGTSSDQAEGLVNHALYIPGVQMCFLATEVSPAQTKFSLRALKPHDVSGIAVSFGGGGHLQAAGCTLDLPLDEAMEKMKLRMRQEICD